MHAGCEREEDIIFQIIRELVNSSISRKHNEKMCNLKKTICLLNVVSMSKTKPVLLTFKIV